MAQLQERLERALAERYTIERELGRGGMSVVFLAWDRKNEREVALKVLRPELSATLGPERFLREIKVAARLKHPYILKLHDSGEADGLLYYVMPYVEGESLRQRLTRERRLPVADALQIAREVAEALDYAHRQDLIHRDIKPENILFEAGHAVVSDFGIARAISAAEDTRVTGTGLVLGTVDYMSPEQARGRSDLDGRTDVYSLGLVLYEMLSGETAGLDVDGTVKTLERLRPEVPPAVGRAVRRALAPDPAGRFATAGEFGAALLGATRPSRSAWRLGGRWARVGVAAVASVAALTFGVKIAFPKIVGPRLDSSLYVVVPFGHRGGAAPQLLNGDQCELLISQAFSRWTDVRVVDRMQVQDALLRGGDTAITLAVAKDVARRLRAGMLVWGDVADVGDSALVTAALYDLTRGRSEARHTSVRVKPETSDLAAKFHEMADSLLLNVTPRPDVVPGAVGTKALAAWYAYAEAHEALGRWDLAAAERAFRRATALDPNYPHAHLWLAHTLAWSGQSVDAWRSHAVLAAGSTDSLGSRDRALARALAALAEGDYAQACERYEGIVRREPRLFAAWFGLGECHRWDHVVVRDRLSPSGWRWRTSVHTAAAAYERALDVAPSFSFAFRPFSRLADVLYVESYTLRWGRALPPDTGTFLAHPSLEGDTLAFVPLPVDEFAGSPAPPTLDAAVAANRQRLLRIVRRWVREFPDSSQPYHELGSALEFTGALEGGVGVDRSALAAARRARETARSRTDSLAATVLEVRVLVKLRRFEAAAELARDALGRWREPEPRHAARLASLAALTGRAHLTARLAALRADTSQAVMDYGAVPLPVLAASFALLGYAAVGAPAESMAVFASRVDTLLQVHADPGMAAGLRCGPLLMPFSLAFPQIGRGPGVAACPPVTAMLRMQQALAGGDHAAVRGHFNRAVEFRRTGLPGDLALEHVYHETWLLLEVGDTAAATAHADRHLSALRALRRTVILDQPEQTGALVRLMALRAELAARAGDRGTARRWAEPVVILWGAADPELQGIVQEMRALVRGGANTRRP